MTRPRNNNDGYPGPFGRRPAGRGGFTLLEILVTVAVVGFVMVGTLQLFVYSAVLSKAGGNMTFASSAAESVMETIRNHNYANITTDFGSGGTPGDTFIFTNPNGAGHVYIDSSDPDLLEIDIVVCWEEADGRIIGEDTDLDGVLDAGEDANGNGKIDSSLTMSTLLANRSQ